MCTHTYIYCVVVNIILYCRLMKWVFTNQFVLKGQPIVLWAVAQPVPVVVEPYKRWWWFWWGGWSMQPLVAPIYESMGPHPPQVWIAFKLRRCYMRKIHCNAFCIVILSWTKIQLNMYMYMQKFNVQLWRPCCVFDGLWIHYLSHSSTMADHWL